MNKKDRQSTLSAEDIALFRRAAGAVKPMVVANRAKLVAKRSTPPDSVLRENQPQALEDMLSDFEPVPSTQGAELSFVRSGVQRTQLRKMRRGIYPIRRELDLHGMTADEARQQLVTFLQECLAHEERCVRVIHGKGYHSHGRQPILKSKLDQWLRQCRQVLAFCSAPTSGGGTGAVYILLSARQGS